MSDHNDEVNLIKAWYCYNSYVRKKYLAAVEKLPAHEIIRDRGASFPSILDILAHTIDAYWYWFFSYHEESREASTRVRGRVHTIQELKEEEKKMDSTFMDLVEGLNSSDLDDTFEISDNSNKWRYTLRQMLWHLVEEELQHRGELNALFWQIDVDPPITDWIDWRVEVGEIKPLQ